jgi:hypothetical protein
MSGGARQGDIVECEKVGDHWLPGWLWHGVMVAERRK